MRTTFRNLVKPVVLLALVGAVTGATTVAAEAASPPTAVTGPASALTVTAATLSGDVGPLGSATTWFFEYGTTTNYGLRTTASSAGDAAHTVAVATRVEGLTPGTIYHERLVAANSGGTQSGADVTFQTPAVTPTILSVTASPVHDTSARVVARLIANGLATTWVVRFGPTASYGSTTSVRAAGSATTPVTVVATLGKLLPNTTYHYDVVATNAAGTKTGADQYFLTTGPPFVTSTSFTSLTTTSVTLIGTVLPGGHGTNWYFQYGTGAYTAATPARAVSATTRPVAVAKAIGGLTPDTTYHFRLVATNAAGVADGPDVTFTTPGPTIASSSSSTGFGHPVTLSGTAPTGTANEVVTLYAEPFGTPSFVEIASLLTGAGGTWAYATAPSIQTIYMTRWKNESSPLLTVGVSPSVTLRGRASGRFVTHVSGARSFAGSIVRLQRLRDGQWRTIASRPLNKNSSAAFRPHLTDPVSRLRVYLTPYQAGAGYLAGYSGVHVFHAS
jgi:hypothetical protein